MNNYYYEYKLKILLHYDFEIKYYKEFLRESFVTISLTENKLLKILINISKIHLYYRCIKIS